MRDVSEYICQLVVEFLLVLSEFVIVGTYTLKIITNLLNGISSSCFCHLLAVGFLSVCHNFLIDNKVHSNLPSLKEYSNHQDSENLISHRAAVSMLYLASSIAASAVHLSSWSAVSCSRRDLTFHWTIFNSCDLHSCFFTVDGIWLRTVRSVVTLATIDSGWYFMRLYILLKLLAESVEVLSESK